MHAWSLPRIFQNKPALPKSSLHRSPIHPNHTLPCTSINTGRKIIVVTYLFKKLTDTVRSVHLDSLGALRRLHSQQLQTVLPIIPHPPEPAPSSPNPIRLIKNKNTSPNSQPLPNQVSSWLLPKTNSCPTSWLATSSDPSNPTPTIPLSSRTSQTDPRARTTTRRGKKIDGSRLVWSAKAPDSREP